MCLEQSRLRYQQGMPRSAKQRQLGLGSSVQFASSQGVSVERPGVHGDVPGHLFRAAIFCRVGGFGVGVVIETNVGFDLGV